MSEVSIAFFKNIHPRGHFGELEPNGQFAHVAISVGPYWLHAHPWRGVELVEELTSIGTLSRLVTMPEEPEVRVQEILHLIGIRYELLSPWESPHTYNCSKLVGQLLDIPPRPMNFMGEAWRNVPNLPRGKPGLSPDDIYEWITAQQTWIPTANLCRSVFQSRARGT